MSKQKYNQIGPRDIEESNTGDDSTNLTLSPGIEPSGAGGSPELSSSEQALQIPPNAQTTKSRKWTHLGNVFKKLSGVSEFGPLKDALIGLKEIMESVERASDIREEYKVLQVELESLFEVIDQFMGSGLPSALTVSMENICSSITLEISMIQAKLDRCMSKPLVDAARDIEEILACYRRIQGHIDRLSLNVNFSTLKFMGEQIQETRLDRIHALLDRLNPAHSARYDSAQGSELNRGPCTRGTRIDVLDRMIGWACDPQSESLYWVNGMAGTGKTTISYSLCAQLESINLLAASFFCTRALSDCKDVNRILPSIAYQLAEFSGPYSYELCHVLQNNRDIHLRVLERQFEALIVNPLIQPNVRKSLPNVVVVVIDALDECENKDSTSRILSLLLTKDHDIPIKFFVFSRPEVEIREQMVKQPNIQDTRLVLHELDKAVVQSDIKTYLESALSILRPRVSRPHIDALAQRSGELFIYAATAVRYIGHKNFTSNPLARLQDILDASSADGSNPHQDLDQLYRMILKAAFDDPGLGPRDIEVMKLVLNATICCQEPVSIHELSELLGLWNPEQVRAALQPLWSVLHVMGRSELVTTLHASFPDFMLDLKRSGEYYCEARTYHDLLAQFCFAYIRRSTPKFNICGLESSFQPDDDIEDLASRVQTSIPSLLFYSCRYWASHLALSSQSIGLIEDVKAFLSMDLLLWMEVLNLKKVISMGPGIIHCAVECAFDYSSETLALARDAARFVTSFATSQISQSTPHIYLSMLPFWPQSSPISTHYQRRMHGMIKAEGKAVQRIKPTLLTEWTIPGQGTTATISPDGKLIVVAIHASLYVLDSFTSQAILDPLEGHTGAISSVDFAPNGSYIVSGSTDGTIRTWDSHSGRQMADPFAGHTATVVVVAVSPNSKLVASGSEDCTVRVWDYDQGGKLIHLIEGHKTTVLSLRFFPDGRAASISSDSTVCLWNTQYFGYNPGSNSPLHHDVNEGQTFLKKPLASNLDTVGKPKYMPNLVIPEFISKRIPSSQRSQSTSGEVYLSLKRSHNQNFMSSVTLPLSLQSRHRSLSTTSYHSESSKATLFRYRKHSKMSVKSNPIGIGSDPSMYDPIVSVDFSPNGELIVSASRGNDQLRLWNSKTGHLVSILQDFAGFHGPGVNCVRFTPLGTHIIAGYKGGVVRVWDVQTRSIVLGPLTGHAGDVAWVGCSHDSVRAFSLSSDQSIRVWDLQSEQTAPGPVRESKGPAVHGHVVASVTFTPDGTKVVAANGSSFIQVWDAGTGQLLSNHFQKGYHIRYSCMADVIDISPDGKRVVCGDLGNAIRIWYEEKNWILLNGHTKDALVKAIRFSRDGNHIVSVADQEIIIWDGMTGVIQQQFSDAASAHDITSVDYFPNQSVIAASSTDKSILLYDMKSIPPTKRLLVGHQGPVNSVEFYPNGTLLVSGSEDKTVRVWAVKAGRLAASPLRGHAEAITLVRFSPDGHRIASASADQSIYLWDYPSGAKILGPLRCQTESINRIAFSPDSSRLVSSSKYNDFGNPQIVVWNVKVDGYLWGSSEEATSNAGAIWELKSDGWIKADDHRLLVWVPHDLRSVILPVRVVMTEDTDKCVILNFDNAFIGKSWIACYEPAGEPTHSVYTTPRWKQRKAQINAWCQSYIPYKVNHSSTDLERAWESWEHIAEEEESSGGCIPRT